MYGPNRAQRAEYYRFQANKARAAALQASSQQSTEHMYEAYMELADAWEKLAHSPTEHVAV